MLYNRFISVILCVIFIGVELNMAQNEIEYNQKSSFNSNYNIKKYILIKGQIGFGPMLMKDLKNFVKKTREGSRIDTSPGWGLELRGMVGFYIAKDIVLGFSYKYIFDEYTELKYINSWLPGDRVIRDGDLETDSYQLEGLHYFSRSMNWHSFIQFGIGFGNLETNHQNISLGKFIVRSKAPSFELNIGSEKIWTSLNIRVNFQIGFRYLSFNKSSLSQFKPALSVKYNYEQRMDEISEEVNALEYLNYDFSGISLNIGVVYEF